MLDKEFKQVETAIDELVEKIPNYVAIYSAIKDLQLSLQELQKALEKAELINKEMSQ